MRILKAHSTSIIIGALATLLYAFVYIIREAIAFDLDEPVASGFDFNLAVFSATPIALLLLICGGVLRFTQAKRPVEAPRLVGPVSFFLMALATGVAHYFIYQVVGISSWQVLTGALTAAWIPLSATAVSALISDLFFAKSISN
ncbi:hypothetical protein HMPREF0044_1229 [Gleimia coleocanis DSM 15436]|uniref:Uncharacterized protein n=1 Tax=Gleimia coleocanis DSM 15436 TaxID=525245 RepID=C0W1D9_9ACTO|nr:hypothetical protein [Gleimia coleocanis]EEH63512.1 hypothetical protein HMPREF0044_1229 [Gleimia coleocanis DSM 15436]